MFWNKFSPFLLYQRLLRGALTPDKVPMWGCWSLWRTVEVCWCTELPHLSSVVVHGEWEQTAAGCERQTSRSFMPESAEDAREDPEPCVTGRLWL